MSSFEEQTLFKLALRSLNVGERQFTVQMSVTQSNRAREGNREQQERSRGEDRKSEIESWAGVKVISLVGWR